MPAWWRMSVKTKVIHLKCKSRMKMWLGGWSTYLARMASGVQTSEPHEKAWCCRSVTPALGRQRVKDQKFKIILSP